MGNASPLSLCSRHAEPDELMDAFEEPFWNLDQLRAWALTQR
jgi:hypothetical protein